MSNLLVNDTSPVRTLENTKAWSITPLKNISDPQVNKSVTVKADANLDFNYTIDRESNALHLKVKTADGEVVREVVFDKIDVSIMDTTRLKGVLLDDRS